MPDRTKDRMTAHKNDDETELGSAYLALAAKVMHNEQRKLVGMKPNYPPEENIKKFFALVGNPYPTFNK